MFCVVVAFNFDTYTYEDTYIHLSSFQAFAFSVLVKCMEFCRFLMLMDLPKLPNITNFEPTSYKLNQTLVFLDQLLDSLNWINPKHICVIWWTHIFAPAHYALSLCLYSQYMHFSVMNYYFFAARRVYRMWPRYGCVFFTLTLPL